MKESREPEFPTEERLRVYGDFAFLAMRSAHHRKMSVSILQAALEPPILLGQYKIFRFDGIPRGALTWAWLSQDAEERYLEGEGFTFADWKSGDRLWIIDLMAPYKGLTAGIVRWVMKEGNMPEPRFSFRRVDGDRDTRKVVNIDITRRGNMAQVLQG